MWINDKLFTIFPTKEAEDRIRVWTCVWIIADPPGWWLCSDVFWGVFITIISVSGWNPSAADEHSALWCSAFNLVLKHLRLFQMSSFKTGCLSPHSWSALTPPQISISFSSNLNWDGSDCFFTKSTSSSSNCLHQSFSWCTSDVTVTSNPTKETLKVFSQTSTINEVQVSRKRKERDDLDQSCFIKQFLTFWNSPPINNTFIVTQTGQLSKIDTVWRYFSFPKKLCWEFLLMNLLNI